MSEKPFPALCMHCKYSQPDEHFPRNNRCFHPQVIAKDSWALAKIDDGKPFGSSCQDERQRWFFAACGRKGKLWEPRQHHE